MNGLLGFSPMWAFRAVSGLHSNLKGTGVTFLEPSIHCHMLVLRLSKHGLSHSIEQKVQTSSETGRTQTRDGVHLAI